MGFAPNLAAVDAAVASYFDTRLFTATRMVQPARAVNAFAAPSTVDLPFAFAGTIEAEPRLSAIAREQYAQPSTDTNRQTLRLCLTALATGWPWMPRKGDRIDAWPGSIGVGTAERFELVQGADQDGSARVVLWLTRLAPSPGA